MANNQDKVSLPIPNQPVGTMRGGPPHLTDGISAAGAKGLLTPRELGRGVTPQPSNITTDKGIG